jgi:polyisoprenyl-teichoic acid--peptidoglycan teichoic acid transferase
VNDNRTTRLVILILALALVVAFVALAWQNYGALSASAPMPTRMATAVASQPTLTPTSAPTDTPSPTSTPTPDHSPTPGPSPTPSLTPTASATPTETPIPTASPTSRPQLIPTLGFETTGTLDEDEPTPVTAIPSPVPTFEVPLNTTNVLLLGSDTALSTGDARTDTMIIVSINRTGPTASIISLPRDLYVYIPGWTMGRLNTALSHGSAVGYPGGGVALLKQTILYNFGVPIHYYARVDFDGFEQIVDAIGGVEMRVSCRLEDWRLKSPELNKFDEDNWERFALEPGVYHMDGDLALWYARSRLSTSDFDRGRRQQQLLRAMLNHGLDLNLLPQVPTLWNAFQNTVDTDMDIGRLLQLATLAPAIRENGIQHLYLAGKMQPWAVPETDANVQLPIWEGDNMMRETFLRLFLPPALNRATRAPITVEIINATDNSDLALLAADNLAWYGFVPVIGTAEPQEGSPTSLTFYGPNLKSSYDWLISWVFHKRSENIEVNSVDPFPYNYRIVLGDDYNPCLNQLYAPQSFLE